MYRKFDETENFFFWNSTFLVELNLGVLESLCVAVEARAGARLLARETAVLMHHGISGAI
jgi:hypothetical protein